MAVGTNVFLTEFLGKRQANRMKTRTTSTTKKTPPTMMKAMAAVERMRPPSGLEVVTSSSSSMWDSISLRDITCPSKLLSPIGSTVEEPLAGSGGMAVAGSEGRIMGVSVGVTSSGFAVAACWLGGVLGSEVLSSEGSSKSGRVHRMGEFSAHLVISEVAVSGDSPNWPGEPTVEKKAWQ